MTRRLRLAALLACAWSATAPGLSAQEARGARPHFGVAVARSVASSMSANPPSCPGTCSPGDVLESVSLVTLELELAFPLLDRPAWGVEYTARAIPLAVAWNNPMSAALFYPGIGGWVLPDGPDGRTAGLGLKPLGVRLRAGPRAVHLRADASAGFLRFGTPMLAANGTRFNFSLEAGLGLGVDVGRGSVISGWRWHHLSNGGFGEVNPGLNSHVVYLGFELR